MSDGSFECLNSFSVTFSMGKIDLGSITSVKNDGLVTPQDLVGVAREDINNPKVINIATLLQSLDSDGDVSNGITIEDTSPFNKLKDNINLSNSNVDIAKVVHSVAPDIKIKDKKEVIKHLQEMIDSVDDNNKTNTNMDYSYIPTGNKLTSRMAVRFLDMATFGATKNSIKALQQKGVVHWVDEELSKPWNYKEDSVLYNMLYSTLALQPYYFVRYTPLRDKKFDTPQEINDAIQEFLDPNNDLFFGRATRSHKIALKFHSSALVTGHIESKSQLRQRVAYALSQIVIASQSTDKFFTDRAEALSYYYDILLKNAFDNYATLLYNVTLSPAMAKYLSYANNRKAYRVKERLITPDENYGREIMQLFTIGLFNLNLDGSLKYQDGRRVPTYDQKDVNEISRVFTGMTYPHQDSKRGHGFVRSMFISDTTHPLICDENYHDSGEKNILGSTLPATSNCFEDVKNAINLLISHPNTAPFIAKKLILRLTHSNPSKDYIYRVATVFKESNGNLKQTVRAILLDPDLWDDIVHNRGTKIKEPYVAFINTLRAMGVKPFPKVTIKGSDPDMPLRSTEKRYVIPHQSIYFGQWPTWSPTVFNFYEDTFQPNDDEIKLKNFKLPEADIMTTHQMTAIINRILMVLRNNEYHYALYYNRNSKDRVYSAHSRMSNMLMILNFEEFLEYFHPNKSKPFNKISTKPKDMQKALSIMIDDVSMRLLGMKLNETFKQQLIEDYKNKIKTIPNYWSEVYTKMKFIERIISPVIVEIVISPYFMIH